MNAIVSFDNSRGATTFLVAAMKKTRAEIQAVLADPNKLCAAAGYHNIKPEWAAFYLSDELNRTERKG